MHAHTVSKEEVEKLLYGYRTLATVQKGLDRGMFRDLLHNQFSMSDDQFMDRVFKAFDRDSDGFLSQEEWVLGMSVFLRGTLEEKIKCKSFRNTHNDTYTSPMLNCMGVATFFYFVSVRTN